MIPIPSWAIYANQVESQVASSILSAWISKARLPHSVATSCI